ncbi:MAG: CaiB/BaiF CoA transferase family protein [Lautropia sp.]
MAGPLAGLKVVEMVGLGPGPFCAMMLADMGATVVRIDRPRATSGVPGQGAAPGEAGDPVSAQARGAAAFDVTARGRPCVALDLRRPGAVDTVLDLVAQADVLIEGFRPGVMERLGLGPDTCLARRPCLVYGRMTGWGQTGPLAKAAGHDLNYIALTGALHAIGRQGVPPSPPLNLVGDFGGGAMMLAFGLVCGVLEARASGKGQVVDCAMTDGAALLSAMMYGMKARGAWTNARESNLLDGGAPYYDTYACADGRFVSIGALEEPFHAELLARCGIDDPAFAERLDRRRWPDLKAKLAAIMRTRTRDEWCALLEGSDACFAPVLDWDEAPKHPHNVARGTFVEIDGVVQPAPAPRFSRTVCATPTAPEPAGLRSIEVLRAWGVDDARIDALRAGGAIA